MDTKLECEVDVDVEGTVDMMIRGEEIRRGHRRHRRPSIRHVTENARCPRCPASWKAL